MPLNPEVLAKLTTTLASDVDLFNTILNEVQTNDTAIAEKETEIQTVKQKLEESELRGSQYLGQISNLLSKIPVGTTQTPQSVDQKFKEIQERSWAK